MSFTYLLESGEVSSAQSFSDIHQFAPSKLTSTTDRYCLPDSETESFRDSQSGTMCGHLMGINGGDQLTLFVEDSHAKTLAGLVNELESLASEVGYGKSISEFCKKYSRDLFLQKTQADSSGTGLMSCLKTLHRWGMMQNGVVSPLPALVRPMNASDALFWPTPASRGRKGTGGAVGLKGGSAAFARLVGLVGREKALGMSCGRLNPQWSEYYLMGWPMGWTDITPLGTDKWREWLRWHGRR